MMDIINGLQPYQIGTKNVAKTMKSITEGTVKDRGTKWFPELSDKRITNYSCFYLV